MSEVETTSANMTEAADPSETQGANESEVAEPAEVEADEQTDEQSEEEPADEQDSKTNAAFAEQRRRIAELEKELEERDKAKELAESEAQEQAELDEQVQAIVEYAREQGLDDDEIEDILDEFFEDHETDKELKRLQDEIDRRDEELVDIQLQQLAMQDLAEVQKIDPNIKDLDDLGDEFFRLRSLDIEPKRAYYMIHSADEQMKPHGAYAPGKINQAKQESEYYTSEELDNLSKEEMHANWDKVMRSMNRL